MAKEFFKDLPDTTTPLNASRLNGLLDGEEALGNIVVDSIRSKNIFNKNSYNFINGYILSGNTTISATGSGVKILYIPCEPNTTYTIQKVASKRFSIGTTRIIPAVGVEYYDGIYGTTATTQLTITTESQAKYLIVEYYLSGSSSPDTLTEQQIIDSIQIETGSTASTYSPFQELGTDNFKNEEIVVGSVRTKNMLDMSQGRVSGTIANVTISYNSNEDCLILNGASSSVGDIYEIQNNYNVPLYNYINAHNGTYVLSNNLGFENYIRTTDGYHVNRATTTDTNRFINAFVRIPANRTFNNEKLKIQFERGQSATEYMPFQNLSGLIGPIELLDYTSITQGSEYTLNDNITNYRYIIVQLSSSSNDANANRQYIPVSLIKSYDNSNRVAISVFQSTTVYMFGDFYFSASNKIYCYGYTKGTTGWTARLKVYGLK